MFENMPIGTVQVILQAILTAKQFADTTDKDKQYKNMNI